MKLVNIENESDIPEMHKGTPVGDLLRYNNLGVPFKQYDSAQLLVGMCMDHRKHLCIPDNFAYIIRTGGANLRYSEFKVSYAVAVGRIRHIVLIGHNNCGMVNLISKKKAFIDGLVEIAQWDKMKAEEHFVNYVSMFEIDNEIDFVVSEAKRLTNKYKITVAPLFYKIEDNRIYCIYEE